MFRPVQLFVGFAMCLAAGPVCADIAQDIQACAAIRYADGRLVCYDKLAKGVASRAEMTAPSAPAPAPIAEAPAAAAPPPAPTPTAERQIAALPQAPVSAVAEPVKKTKKGGFFHAVTFGLFGHHENEEPAPQAVAEARPSAPANDMSAGPALPPSADKAAAFGAETLAKPKRDADEKPEELRDNVQEFAFNGHGKVIVFLANGQIWRQLDGDDALFHLSPKRSYVAVIRRGIMGSYNLKIEGLNKLAKVQRVK
jgi:hypothetical protein